MEMDLSPTSTSSSDSFHTALPSSMAADALLFVKPIVVPINDDVRQEVNIYFDEELYSSAIILLTDLITAGASSAAGAQNPIYVPATFHIELVSALLIHPRHTNQATAQERADLPAQCITFLRNLLAILGPVDSNLAEAFSLSVPPKRPSRRSRTALEFDDGSSTSDGEDGSEKIKGVIANRGRIRNCAKDFWHMVGWAFNCSVRYPHRWKYWKVWLDFMLDVLDKDWNERQASILGSKATDCLLLQCLSDIKGRSSALKRVVRSAFADGSLESLKEFPEVFPDETRELKLQNGQKRKRDDLDRSSSYLFNGEDEAELTGQIFLDDEVEDLLDVDPWLGGPESIMLRQRVIVLLSRASDAHPNEFCQCRDLYDAINGNIKPLPLPAFSLFLSPSLSTQLIQEVYVSMTQLVLLRLLQIAAPRPETVSTEENDQITQDILEQCFLPFSAQTSSVAENAKVSILVEYLLRLLFAEGLVCHTPTLDAAVERGIATREAKARSDKRKKDTSIKRKAEENDFAFLKASGQRLRSLLLWIEQQERP